MTDNLDALRAATDAARSAEIEALERRLLRLRGQDESLANFYEFHEKYVGPKTKPASVVSSGRLRPR